MSHVRKPKLIEQRLQQYSQYVVTDPVAARGTWRQRFLAQNANASETASTSTGSSASGMPNAPHETAVPPTPGISSKSPISPMLDVSNKHAASLAPSTPRLHVDLGCGKGLWTTRVAAANPQSLFVGVDMERMCVSFAAEQAGESQLANALFTLDVASNVETSFADGEVDVLHANFPTPFPRLKDAQKRVTDARQLMAYRRMLGKDGLFCLKTDSQFMFDFTMNQLESAGYTILWHTRDLHGEYAEHGLSRNGCIDDALESICEDSDGTTEYDGSSLDRTANSNAAEAPMSTNGNHATSRTELNRLAAAGPLPTDFVESAYERKLVAKGAKVHVLHAIPGPAPTSWTPTEFVSLFDYLPDDLEQIAYMPLGMEDAITNMRNRQRNAQAKAALKRR